MLNLKDKRQLFTVILAALTVLFIFIHSLMAPEVSSKESDAVSDAVSDVVVGVIGDETPAQIERSERATKFIEENMRKIAHFIEFAVLGSEIALMGYFVLSDQKRKGYNVSRVRLILISFIFGILIAFADESLQLVSNRGPSVADIWLDISGFSALMIPLYVILFVVTRKKFE